MSSGLGNTPRRPLTESAVDIWTADMDGRRIQLHLFNFHSKRGSYGEQYPDMRIRVRQTVRVKGKVHSRIVFPMRHLQFKTHGCVPTSTLLLALPSPVLRWVSDACCALGAPRPPPAPPSLKESSRGGQPRPTTCPRASTDWRWPAAGSAPSWRCCTNPGR